MFEIVKARIKQGHRTMAFPKGPAPQRPQNFKGYPQITCGDCQGENCVDACPTDAISACARNSAVKIKIDLGRCIFCTKCVAACGHQGIQFSSAYSLAATTKDCLHTGSDEQRMLVKPLDTARLKLFRKSLKLRQVSAGGCNACEADTNVLTTIAWDLRRFGVDFVASPRHADGILVTGPISKNMAWALKNTYEAIAGPKVVIALGACAISGGLFRTHDETLGGIGDMLPVDLYIPGCPPHPLTILDGILRMLGRI